MTDPFIAKCAKENGRLMLCIGLRRVVSEGQNLGTLDRVNAETRTTTTVGVAYYSDTAPHVADPPPLALNYCPFCGADIRITAAN